MHTRFHFISNLQSSYKATIMENNIKLNQIKPNQMKSNQMFVFEEGTQALSSRLLF